MGWISVRKALRMFLTALSLFLMTCAPAIHFYHHVDRSVARGDYEAAIRKLRENHHRLTGRNEVLYLLDMGLLFHYAGQPDSSIKYLLAAERRIEELYTKRLSREAAAMLINDNVLPYAGEDFEKVLVNVFLALDFAEKGEIDEALVEARKVDLKLRNFTARYEGKNRYQEDPFARYLTGVLYETAGEINDAFIAYRKAYEAYQKYGKEFGVSVPRFLLDDLVRTATLMQFSEERDRFLAAGGHPYDPATEGNLGSLLVVIYAGKGPVKVETRTRVSIPDSSGIVHTFTVALPKFQPRYQGRRRYTVVAASPDDSLTTRSVVAADITTLAEKSLNDRLGLIYLKSGGRALLKFLAAEKIKSKWKSKPKKKKKPKGKTDNAEETEEDSGGSFLSNFFKSLFVDAVVEVSERADTRCWRTLPAQIQLARLHLPPGEYSLRVSANDGGFQMSESPVEINSRRTTFVIVDDVR